MYSDWESSLTELSSDEDEYIPNASKKKKAPPRKTKGEYKVANALRPYRTTTYTAKSLYDQIIDNTIHLDPEYQRDIVWSEAKQSGLIDSILRNYYIPPVLFAVTTHDDGSQSRVCIDGKQRLTSIQLFMDGLIPHKDNVTGKKYWYKAAAGETRIILPRPLMQAFANKQITCIEYDGLHDDEEREIFQRVQLGVALTVAERMQAIPGHWPKLIRQVQSIILGERGFGEDLDWGTDRGRDFQCLATIMYLIDSQPSTSTTFPGCVKLEKWLQSSAPVPEKTRAAVLETFHIFVALVKDNKYKIAFKKPSRVAPVEFSMIGLLIYLYKDKFSFMQLSQAIWQLRADVRKVHEDVRANNKVTKTMFTFLHKRLKQANLPSDGKGDTPAAVVIRERMSGEMEDDMRESPPVPKVKKEKRRRVQESESSDDSDYEKAPPKRRVSMPSAASTGRSSSSKTSTKNSGSRKVSAPATAAKASTSKAASKAPAKNTKATRAAASLPAQTSPSTSSQAAASTVANVPTKITSRTTRTSLAAAGDVLFPPEPSTSQSPISIPLAPALSRAKEPAKEPPKPGGSEPVVKMEVDPSPSVLLNTQDENAMVVDETAQEAQQAQQAAPSTTAQTSSIPANPTTTSPTTPSAPASRHASSGMTLPRPAALSLNTSVLRSASTASPSLPAPPPPPPLSAGASPSITGNVPRFAAMTIHDARSPPIAPRSDRERRRTGDSDWDMDRGRGAGRDRDREHDRDRDRYDRDRDHHRGRDRSRERERDKDREPKDWERPDRERDRQRGGRSRESDRDRYRYGRDRRINW